MKISQQALSERLRTLPPELFLRVLLTILPSLHARWQQRERPLPAEIAWAEAHYNQVAVVDGSTLDALIRKIGLLRDLDTTPLAGRMTGLLDLCSHLPLQVWYETDPQAHDQRFWSRILTALTAGALLLFDLGYTNFAIFGQLTAGRITFITRAKSNLVHQVERVLSRSSAVHDRVVWIGKGDERQMVRLIEVLYQGKWYRYLTNELDAKRLPTAYVVALYWQRWRIEDAYAIVKRLLGLAYFYGHCRFAVPVITVGSCSSSGISCYRSITYSAAAYVSAVIIAGHSNRKCHSWRIRKCYTGGCRTSGARSRPAASSARCWRPAMIAATSSCTEANSPSLC